MPDIVSDLQRRERLARLRRSLRQPASIPARRTQRNPILVTAGGESKSIPAWVADPRCTVTAGTLWGRIRRGWEHERAITEPTSDEPAPIHEEVDISVIVDILEALAGPVSLRDRLKAEGRLTSELSILLDPSIPTESFCPHVEIQP